jgi:hypothetical protein
MGFVSDAAGALKNVVLMQSNIERLERAIERQDGDIAVLREVISVMNDRMATANERIVRMETKFEIYEAQASQRRLER